MGPPDFAALTAEFDSRTPQEILAWAVAQYAPQIGMSTAFGPGGIVLLHMLRESGLRIPVFYIDTGLLFPEVQSLREQVEQTFGIPIERVCPTLSLAQQAELFGDQLWERDPDRCCWLRKVLPLRQVLRDKRAWISAIRADQTPLRAQAQVVMWDERNQVVKIHPLLRWSEEQVWEYIHRHHLPYHPLHDQGYPSLGCLPCTTPVAKGEDRRSGRWRGRAKVECGLHGSILPQV